jgi:hypothetical protein
LLFALYLGWSQDGYLGERHCIEFVAAPSDLKSISKVNANFDKTNKIDLHIDNKIGVDGCINVQEAIEGYVELIPTDVYFPNEVINYYKKI